MKWVFWISVALLLYTYAGYPAWLWLRRLYRSRPLRSSSYRPSLSIVMVVRNEASVLERKLENLLSLDYPEQLREIIVVSDGSSDSTNEILRHYARDPCLRMIAKPEFEGKAAGLNDAVGWARGEVVLFTDARQTLERNAASRLIESLADPSVGCSSGELMLGDPDSGEVKHGMGLYWRIEKRVREMESEAGSVVGATGAIYAVRRSLVVSLPRNTILDDVYIPMHVVRQGYRVIFDPGARAWDVPDLGEEREFSRKVRTLSGNYQLLQLAPWLLSSANPLRFEFISHKLMRLLAPFALVGAFVSALVVHEPLYRAALLLQMIFYLLSGIAKTKLAMGPVARMADAARTFVILNSAATLAFLNFVTGRRISWGKTA
ncbi:MAG: glycosyltransferase family 2 protein [Acidobacteria bacterium]|nr:glycosyltransferase family 2 protein [Acidobacteriota bacterium]